MSVLCRRVSVRVLERCAIAVAIAAAGCDQQSPHTTTAASPAASSQANPAVAPNEEPATADEIDALPMDDDLSARPADESGDGTRRIHQIPGTGIRAGGRIDIAYGPVLRSLVTDDGRVRYERLRERETQNRLHAATDQYRFMGVPNDRAAKLAFLINAYNANVLEMTAIELNKSGFTTVGAVDGFFDRPIAVGRATTTLNRLLHEQIRPIADARVHAALVRSARSCPPLRRDIYYAQDLEEHLDEQCRLWLSMPSTAQVKDGTIVLCEVFKTHGEHFQASAGSIDDGIRAFLRAHAAPDSPLAIALAGNAAPPLTYAEYDWTPNAAPLIATPAAADASTATTSNTETTSQ